MRNPAFWSAARSGAPVVTTIHAWLRLMGGPSAAKARPASTANNPANRTARIRLFTVCLVRLPHVPAHACQVDEVHLAPPRELHRRLDPKLRVLFLELLAGHLVPPQIEVRHVEPDHEVACKLLVVETLQDELRRAVAEAGIPAVLPGLFEAKIA